jgi:UDP-glucose 4-epimerase
LQKKLKNKKIVVLGGAGFIGSHLIDYLIKNTQFDIVSIGRGKLPIFSDRLTEYCLDITLENLITTKINELDIISFINCAGGGNVQESHQQPHKDFYDTTACTADVLEYIRFNNLSSAYIQLSSAAVYGNCFEFPISVDTPLKPISAYGYNNLMAENLVSFYSKVYGVKTAILRIFSVYGNGLKKQILWDACLKMHQGNNSFFGTGQEVRDFINIDDLVGTIFNVIQFASDTSPVFNCGSGKGTKICDFLIYVQKHFDNLPKLKFSGEVKVGDPIGYIADISKSPIEQTISIDDGISSYVNWFKKEL